VYSFLLVDFQLLKYFVSNYTDVYLSFHHSVRRSGCRVFSQTRILMKKNIAGRVTKGHDFASDVGF
jgi:hypothetical protein